MLYSMSGSEIRYKYKAVFGRLCLYRGSLLRQIPVQVCVVNGEKRGYAIQKDNKRRKVRFWEEQQSMQ